MQSITCITLPGEEPNGTEGARQEKRRALQPEIGSIVLFWQHYDKTDQTHHNVDHHHQHYIHLDWARLMSCSLDQAGHPHRQVANLPGSIGHHGQFCFFNDIKVFDYDEGATITRRKVTACLPGFARACALVPVVRQLASRRNAVCKRGWTSMARAASSWSRWSSGLRSERRLARATRPAWLHTPS